VDIVSLVDSESPRRRLWSASS